MKLSEPFPATSSPEHCTTDKWAPLSSQGPEQSGDFLSRLQEPVWLLTAGTNIRHRLLQSADTKAKFKQIYSHSRASEIM